MKSKLITWTVIFPSVRDKTGCEDIHSWTRGAVNEPYVIIILILSLVALVAFIKFISVFKKI